MFNLPEIFEVEAEADSHQGGSAPKMAPDIVTNTQDNSGPRGLPPALHRPGEMSGSWYVDPDSPDIFNLPQLYETEAKCTYNRFASVRNTSFMICNKADMNPFGLCVSTGCPKVPAPTLSVSSIVIC